LTRNLFLLASVALIAVVTLTPIRGDDVIDGVFEVSELGDVLEALSESDTRFLLGFALEAAANILLFVPFGAALGLRGLSVGKAVWYGFLLSVAVEGTQWLLIPGRTTSLDDVVLNTFGALVGHVLLTRLKPMRVR
jgi:glycopeptide antibiotics resistance protein